MKSFTKRVLKKLYEGWIWVGHREFLVRRYKTYDDYVIHQKSKLEKIKLSDYDVKFHKVLRDRLSSHNLISPEMNVLCLAARIGTEVKAFHDLGCFAVGLDLEPGHDNKYVVYGDFHNIQFPSGCADVIFTNALDHVLDINRVVIEIKRVLKLDGLLIIEAIEGSDEGITPGAYETFSWHRIDDLIAWFNTQSLHVIFQAPFEYPWRGRHLCFKFSNNAD